MKILVLLFVLLNLSVKTYAFHEAAYGLQAISFANNAMIANPPLPMLYMKAGMNRYSIQGSTFDGDIDTINPAESSSFRTLGEFKGSGGALSFNHAFSESWGLFLIGMGQKMTADFSYTNQTCSPYCNTTEMNDIEGTFTTIGLGLNWTFLGGTENDFLTAGLLFGGSLTNVSMTQRVINTDSSNNVTDNFVMRMNPHYTSLMLGFQIGLRLGPVVFNPYFIGSMGFDDDCHEYEVTETVVAGSLSGQSTPTCSKSNTVNNQIDIKSGFGSAGVNVQIIPWGLSINAVAAPEKPSDRDLKNININAVIVALSFTN